MTFNRNLPQVVICSLSQSEWALSLLSHWEGLSPSIQSFLPDDVTVLRGLGQKRGSGERKRERDRTQPNLIYFFYTCVCLSIREMLTTCHNPFIPIPHHEWLHQPPKYPCNLFTGKPGGVTWGISLHNICCFLLVNMFLGFCIWTSAVVFRIFVNILCMGFLS